MDVEVRADVPDPPAAEVVRVAHGLYSYVQQDRSWWVNSSGFIVSQDRVFGLDAWAARRRTLALLEAIDRTAGLPVTTLVNTQAHGDHTFGNAFFVGATIVGHERARAGMFADPVLTDTPPLWDNSPDFTGLTLTPPTLTFKTEVDLWVGETPVQLRFIGVPAHTDGDVVAWLPEQRVLFTSDLVFDGVTPLLMGSVTGYLEALERVRAFEPEVLVAGHGHLCGPDVLDGLERYARLVLATAHAGLAVGISSLEAARSVDFGEFTGLGVSERIVMNLHRAYSHRSDKYRFNLPAAFGDAVTFHGALLRCVA